jgi:hypothetical protein
MRADHGIPPGPRHTNNAFPQGHKGTDMKTRIYLAGALLLMFTGTASAQSPGWAKASIVFAAAAQGADVVSTVAQPHWTRYEANPVVPKSTAGLVAMKTGVAVVNALVSKRAAAKHPRLVFITQMALGTSLSYVAYHNVQLNRQVARGR